MKNFRENLDKTKTSKYNAGLAQVLRLDEIFQKINRLNQDLLGLDPETGDENYKVKFNCCVVIFLEIKYKLNQPQRDLGDKWVKILEDYIAKFPIRRKKLRGGRPTGDITFIDENWQKIKKALYLFETLVRDFVAKTGMANPEGDDPEMAAYG